MEENNWGAQRLFETGPCGKVCFDKKSASTKRNFLMKKGRERYLRI